MAKKNKITAANIVKAMALEDTKNVALVCGKGENASKSR